MTARFAIYFAPADNSPLGLFGTTALRRTSGDINPLNLPVTLAFHDNERQQSLMAKPARYGFHATIKAPFELDQGCTVTDLMDELKDFTSDKTGIAMPGLSAQRNSGYAALVFCNEQPAALAALAASCVTRFEPFRAPLTANDIARRNPDALTERQRAQLYEYGYAHIFDDFNFHMTLTSALCSADDDYLEWLDDSYQQLVPQPPVFDRLAVFRQTDRLTPFLRIAQYKFGHPMI